MNASRAAANARESENVAQDRLITNHKVDFQNLKNRMLKGGSVK